MSQIVLIAPTTAAVTTTGKSFRVNDFTNVEASQRPIVPILDTVTAIGLQGSEKVTLRITGQGASPADMYDQDAIVTLTATKNVLTLNSALSIDVKKDATVAPTGVYLEKAYG